MKPFTAWQVVDAATGDAIDWPTSKVVAESWAEDYTKSVDGRIVYKAIPVQVQESA